MKEQLTDVTDDNVPKGGVWVRVNEDAPNSDSFGFRCVIPPPDQPERAGRIAFKNQLPPGAEIREVRQD